MDSFLTKWATEKMKKRVDKSALMVVRPVNEAVYEVIDSGKNGLVDFNDRTCTCQKFQFGRLPCAHVVAVSRFLRLSDCYQWCHQVYTTEFLRKVYSESIYPLGDQSEWIEPDVIRTVLLPIRRSRLPGRPRDTRIPSVGEEVRPKRCGRCGIVGHTRLRCPTPMPLQPDSFESGSSSRNVNS